jgi:hypothetical protein
LRDKLATYADETAEAGLPEYFFRSSQAIDTISTQTDEKVQR